jgi:hypothetical protein
MNDLKFTGIITKIFEKETVWKNDTLKQEIIVQEQKDKYPSASKFTFINAGVEQLQFLKEGQNVTVSFSLKVNEYNGKYYNNISWWRVEVHKDWNGSVESDSSDEGMPF